jgi:hypothetical protein
MPRPTSLSRFSRRYGYEIMRLARDGFSAQEIAALYVIPRESVRAFISRYKHLFHDADFIAALAASPDKEPPGLDLPYD